MVSSLLLIFAAIGYVEPWEVETEIVHEAPARTLSPMGQILEKGIWLHQNFLTHTTGPRSHFRPTSSQYMLDAIHAFGFVKGYLMGCDRLLRENGEPWVYRTIKLGEKIYKSDEVKRVSTK